MDIESDIFIFIVREPVVIAEGAEEDDEEAYAGAGDYSRVSVSRTMI